MNDKNPFDNEWTDLRFKETNKTAEMYGASLKQGKEN